ncbi:hypothetical protein V5T82_17965 [Magnetovibrio sp. PR-2]|uniref:hypothetical protein n=1 Tax=Magnetovibrio sp. PR-2 TaxID=3120356 RepID=UPI002FCE10D8
MHGPKLQPLRIPEGWEVEINQLYALDPTKDEVERPVGCFSGSCLLKLSLKSKGAQRKALYGLDVDWHPEGEWDTGGYRVVAYIGDDWWDQVCEFKTKERRAAVEKIEALLHQLHT